MSTPEVVPESSYMTSGLILAALIAGGFVYKKNKSTGSEKEDDIFTYLV
jgi:hypothetical protein